MKGFCYMFVPVQQTENRVQWHAIRSEESGTYLTYYEGLPRCDCRASRQEVAFDNLHSTCVFLGWCSVVHSRLGESFDNFKNLGYSGALEASDSIHFTGAQVGLQQIRTAAANFTIGESKPSITSNSVVIIAK
jgi:hypothetical protein